MIESIFGACKMFVSLSRTFGPILTSGPDRPALSELDGPPRYSY